MNFVNIGGERMHFLSIPYLPTRKVKYVIIDYRTDKKIIKSLEEQGLTVFFTKKIDSLYDAVSGHADMGICHLGGRNFVCEPSVYDYYASTLRLPGINLIKGSSAITSTYPYDIAYNVARVSNFAFHKIKYTDNEILDNLKNVSFVNVSQGYSKCSVCVVSKNAIITDDESIHNKAVENDIDVLLVSKGQISLPGFDYGFIGGATGLISIDVLAVTGNIKLHSDYDKIFDFCFKHGVNILCLSDDMPCDIGSIIPVAYE